MNKNIFADASYCEIISGIPSVANIEAIQSLEVYDRLKKYSSDYLHNNRGNLEGYRWIKDAFNQWSRIYEYPYCYAAIKRNVKPGGRILDAGSGITFFPFFLDSEYSVSCVDQDDYISKYEKINATQHTHVAFKQSHLTGIPYENASFDAIYCVSVLEHTREYGYIINEFLRLLRPDGRLVITFDISLDGSSQGLDSKAAQDLIRLIGEKMCLDYTPAELISDLKKPALYTSSYVKNSGRHHLLPWARPTLKGVVKKILLGKKDVPFSNMTFCNITAQKVVS